MKKRNNLVCKIKISNKTMSLDDVKNLPCVEVIDYWTGKKVGKYGIKDFMIKFG